MNRHLPLILLVAVILVLDQVTKGWVSGHLAPDEFVYPIPALTGFFGFTFVQNTGVAFGLFRDANTLFAVLAAIIVVVIVRYLRTLPPDQHLVRLALTLLVAGALGNLIDRVRLGYVVDFVAVGDFARFNVADSSLSIGVALLILAGLLGHRRKPATMIHE